MIRREGSNGSRRRRCGDHGSGQPIASVVRHAHRRRLLLPSTALWHRHLRPSPGRQAASGWARRRRHLPPDGDGDIRVPFGRGRQFREAVRVGGEADRIVVHFQPGVHYLPGASAAISKIRTSLALRSLVRRRPQVEILVHESTPRPPRWRLDLIDPGAGLRDRPTVVPHGCRAPSARTRLSRAGAFAAGRPSGRSGRLTDPHPRRCPTTAWSGPTRAPLPLRGVPPSMEGVRPSDPSVRDRGQSRQARHRRVRPRSDT